MLSLTEEKPAPFPEYEIEGVGTVIAHEDDSYIVRTTDGRLIGIRAANGEPTEKAAAVDIAEAIANPPPLPEPQADPFTALERRVAELEARVGVK